MSQKRQSYTVSEKLTIIKYAEAHGNRAAGREHSIAESNIRQWRKIKEKLQTMRKSKRADRGKTAKFPEIEQKMIEFIDDRRSAGLPVSTTEIRLKALHFATNNNITDFKASANWCYLFMARHGYSIRRRTHISQKMPEEFDEKLINFQKFIINLRRIIMIWIL